MVDTQVAPATAHVLVVDDDETNRLVAQKLLQLAGVPAEQIGAVAENPISYLQARPADTVDLILLDLHLPQQDGYEVLAELRAIPRFAHIPVVALTADVVQIKRAQEAGFDGFIAKPIDGASFPQWVQRLLTGESIWIAD